MPKSASLIMLSLVLSVLSINSSLIPPCLFATACNCGMLGGLENKSRQQSLRLQRQKVNLKCGLRNPAVSPRWRHVKIRWAPGHTNIEGNEAADSLADAEAKEPSTPFGLAAQPTVSGIRTIRKAALATASTAWWSNAKSKLSDWYIQWKLPYQPTRPPHELGLTRPTLARLLAIRTSHGDFAWYHRKFHHDNATLGCTCGRLKTPLHIALCRKTRTASIFRRWPKRPRAPPRTPSEAAKYLQMLWEEPEDFAAFLEITGFYSAICRPH
jgi:hypothetical protein